MDQDTYDIISESMIFRDIKEVDASYYKNVKWKIETAEKNREEKIDIKSKAIELLIKNKNFYGSLYSSKTEDYLKTVIYPLLSGKEMN